MLGMLQQLGVVASPGRGAVTAPRRGECGAGDVLGG